MTETLNPRIIAGKLNFLISQGKTLFFEDCRGHWREAVCFHANGFHSLYAVAFQCPELIDDQTWENKTPMTAFPIDQHNVKTLDEEIAYTPDMLTENILT